MKKNILITGANKGIGLEMARQLAMAGHQVILTARSETRGKAAQEQLKQQGHTVGFLIMDVTSREQIVMAAKKVSEEQGYLDVLINNAGITASGDNDILDFEQTTLDETMQTNAFSMLNTVAAFAPMMSAGGRIINLSSGLGSMTDPVNGWAPLYGVSKTMVNAITRQQAYALSNKDIAVVAMCPGWVRTDMGGSSAPRDVSEGADTAVWLATTDHIETGKFYRDRKIIPW